jgi:hypothetical protein
MIGAAALARFAITKELVELQAQLDAYSTSKLYGKGSAEPRQGRGARAGGRVAPHTGKLGFFSPCEDSHRPASPVQFSVPPNYLPYLPHMLLHTLPVLSPG